MTIDPATNRISGAPYSYDLRNGIVGVTLGGFGFPVAV